MNNATVLTHPTAGCVLGDLEHELADITTHGIDLRHLRALVAIADELNFGRAALRLHLAQSTLSRTIADLERLVGARLVDRAQRTIGITRAGRRLLAPARCALRELDAGVRALRDGLERAPVLGIMSSLGYEYLPALRRELEYRGAPALEVREIGLADGFEPLGHGVDVGIFPLPLVPPADLEIAVIGASDPWIALPRGHALAGEREIPLSRLLREPLILPPSHAVWRDNFRLLARARGYSAVPAPEAGSMCDALVQVAAGHGWSMAPARADFPQWDGVVVRPAADVERVGVAAMRSRANATPHAELLTDALVAASGWMAGAAEAA